MLMRMWYDKRPIPKRHCEEVCRVCLDPCNAYRKVSGPVHPKFYSRSDVNGFVSERRIE